MMLPGIPTVLLGFILSDDTFSRFRCGRAFSSSLWALILQGEQKHGTESRAQRSHAAKQQLKTIEQASASSDNPSFLGHRSDLVSSYSRSTIARNGVGRSPVYPDWVQRPGDRYRSPARAFDVGNRRADLIYGRFWGGRQVLVV